MLPIKNIKSSCLFCNICFLWKIFYARGLRSGSFKDTNGNQKNSFLADVFEYFKRFLERIYETAKKLGIDANNKQMIEFFDKYLYNPENYGDKDFVYKESIANTRDSGYQDFVSDKSQQNLSSGMTAADPKDNDLITLTILKQSEPNEDLRTSIEKRIQELKDKMKDEIQSKIAEKARYGMDYDEVY